LGAGVIPGPNWLALYGVSGFAVLVIVVGIVLGLVLRDR
jgi:hypothetical protein